MEISEYERSECLERIKELAANEKSKDYLAANKYLIEQPWLKEKVGRPTKDSIAIELKRMAQEEQREKSDLDRLNTLN